MGDVVLAITVIAVGIIDVGGNMDIQDSVWDEEWAEEWDLISQGPLQKPQFDSAPRHPVLSAAPKRSTKPPPTFDFSAPSSFDFPCKSGTPKRPPTDLERRPKSLTQVAPIPVPELEQQKMSESQVAKRPKSQGGAVDSSNLHRAKKPSDVLWIVKLWITILSWFGMESSLYAEIHDSDRFQEFAVVILDAFAPSTMAKYLTCVQSFCNTCDDLRINIQDLTAIHVLDIAQMGKRNSGISGSLLLKSLKWIFRNANISKLAIMESSLIVHWEKAKTPHDRGEALPLPLYVVAAWERRLLEKGCGTIEKLILGSFLFMIWSGLRYADLQRIIWKSISYNISELRAVCWRTKTCTKGQPFGLRASGFLSRGQHNWLFVFLQTQDQIRASSHFQDDQDFMVPAVDSFGVLEPLRPMSYAAALFHFRQALSIPWRGQSLTQSVHAASYTIHGMKSTFLSWASQLAQLGLVTEEQRRQQGHHKQAQASVSLYSRDDTHAQIRYQLTLIYQLQSGWRPCLPQHRGSQLPTVEPEVILEAFRKDVPAYEFKTIRVQTGNTTAQRNLDATDPVTVDSDSSDADSSSSSSSDSSDEEIEKVAHSKSSLECLGRFRSVTHAMILSATEKSNIATWQDKAIQTACGVRFSRDRVQLSEATMDSNDLTFCQHRACHKLLAGKW